MNCQRCNARIDYRFLANCAYCGYEIERAVLPKIDAIPAHLVTSVEKSLTWKQRLINMAYVFVSSIAGMISGAVVVYFTAAIVYSSLFSSLGNPSQDCARGMAVGFLSITSGAFLGTVGGSVFAVKHPLCKMPLNESI